MEGTGMTPAKGFTSRRAFMGGVAAVAAWPLAGRAQQAVMPRIGVLVLGHPDPELFLRPFREGLAARGYTEGRNIVLEVRSAEGRANRLAELAAELVRLKVDVIVSQQTPTAFAAAQATREIPIVISAGDPVGTGLIASLAHPGGNITGVSSATSEIAAKNLELIREVLPQAKRVAVLANSTDPFAKPFLEQIGVAAQRANVVIAPLSIRPSEELAPAFEQIMLGRPDGLIIQPTLLRPAAAELARKAKLVATAPNRSFPEAGGLMAYASDTAANYREAATYVDKILKGAKPADLPVQQPTKFELVVNLKTAKVIGVTIPATVLARADAVIE